MSTNGISAGQPRCNRHGCPKFAAGILWMHIPAKFDRRHTLPTLKMPVPLALCEAHAKDSNAQDFQTADWRAEIVAALEARGSQATPDFDKAWVQLEPFGQGFEVKQGEEHGHA